MKRFLAGIFVLPLGLALASCGSSSSSMTTGPTSVTGSGPASVIVTIDGVNGAMSFSPNPVSVKVGQTLAWKNADTITHQPLQNSTSGGGGGSYSSGISTLGFGVGQVAPGATSSSVSFTSAGTVGYHCAIHPSMTGTINITP
jgi:plastocyanin